MSNFSEALNNAYELYKRGDDQRGRMWTGRGLAPLMEEYDWPDHMALRPRVDVAAIEVTCTRCEERAMVSTVGQALRFRDEHIHCKESTIDVWTCSTCDNGLMNHEKHCRFCWTARPADPEWVQREPADTVGWCECYGVHSQDGELLATLEVPSLLLARRAARHMFRRELVEVYMLSHPSLVWEVEDTGAAPNLQ